MRLRNIKLRTAQHKRRMLANLTKIHTISTTPSPAKNSQINAILLEGAIDGSIKWLDASQKVQRRKTERT
jgi:hypothetical protein